MKFSMKAVAASVLFAVAGGSQAAILNASFPEVDGELYISIFRDTTSPMSMIIDTNVSLLALRDGSVTSWTSSAAQTAAIQAFLGTADLSAFRFNAGGLTNQHDPFDLDAQPNDYMSVFVTINPAGNPATWNGDLLAPQSTIQAFATQINNAYVSRPSFTNDGYVSGIEAGQAGYHYAPLWGNSYGGMMTTFSNETAVGTAAPLYRYFNNSPEMFEYDLAFNLVGFMNIDGVTGMASLSTSSVSPVPVPAAAWLLGSGLIGMVGVARRRKA